MIGHTKRGRIALAGFVGGAVLNLVDTPCSMLVMLPRITAFTKAHGITSSPLTGPWFMLTHFAYMTAIAWTIMLLRERGRSDAMSALLAGGLWFSVNRMFGIGNGFIGILPFSLFWGFTISFAVGTVLATAAAGRVLVRPAG